MLAIAVQPVGIEAIFAEAPVAGSGRDIEVTVGATVLKLRLIYVPSGTALLGRPGAEERSVVLGQPFYIAVDEVSVSAFSACLEDGERSSHDKREKTFITDSDRERMHREGDSFSATMISLEEAARVTARINRELSRARTSTTETLVSERVRLPTAAEWQYAMSCGSQAQHRYINPWPGSASNHLSDRNLARCRELFEKCGRTDEFRATPEQVTWLVEECQGNGAARLEILSFLFPFLLDGRGDTTPAWRRFETKPEPLAETLAVALPNAWGIRGCHRGYPEWVLADSSQASALAVWRRFEDSLATGSDKDQKAFRLCGSNSVVLAQTDLSPLAKVFLFHERSLVSWNDANAADGSIVEDESVGMRVVMVECLSDEWRRIVRSSMLSTDDAAMAENKANTYGEEITRLSGNREQDLAILQTYLGLQEYQSGRFEDSADRIGRSADKISGRAPVAVSLSSRLRKGGGGAGKESSSPPAGDRIFFSSTAKLMVADQRN
jgi:hypothetical protein